MHDWALLETILHYWFDSDSCDLQDLVAIIDEQCDRIDKYMENGLQIVSEHCVLLGKMIAGVCLVDNKKYTSKQKTEMLLRCMVKGIGDINQTENKRVDSLVHQQTVIDDMGDVVMQQFSENEFEHDIDEKDPINTDSGMPNVTLVSYLSGSSLATRYFKLILSGALAHFIASQIEFTPILLQLMVNNHLLNPENSIISILAMLLRQNMSTMLVEHAASVGDIKNSSADPML